MTGCDVMTGYGAMTGCGAMPVADRIGRMMLRSTTLFIAALALCSPALAQSDLGAPPEIASGPVAAAIGNAVFDALGVRVRSMPLTAEAITKAALAD
jgi:hypothetical protein